MNGSCWFMSWNMLVTRGITKANRKNNTPTPMSDMSAG